MNWGLPYAFALQFGDADAATAMRLYRKSFRPSQLLDEPYTLFSAGVVASDDAEEARRETASSSMAMLRMLKRETYSLLPAQEVAAYQTSPNEQAILDTCNRRFINGTAAQVAAALERIHEQTQADEMLLVTMGYSRAIQTGTVQSLADHYSLSGS